MGGQGPPTRFKGIDAHRSTNVGPKGPIPHIFRFIPTLRRVLSSYTAINPDKIEMLIWGPGGEKNDVEKVETYLSETCFFKGYVQGMHRQGGGERHDEAGDAYATSSWPLAPPCRHQWPRRKRRRLLLHGCRVGGAQ